VVEGEDGRVGLAVGAGGGRGFEEEVILRGRQNGVSTCVFKADTVAGQGEVPVPFAVGEDGARDARSLVVDTTAVEGGQH